MADINEPPSAYNAKYPFNNVMQTESGHFQEFDDTPGYERVRTQHRIGTFTEWQPDGNEVHRIVGNGYRIVAKDDNVIIQGKCNINIVGNAEVTIQGDAITNVQGNETKVVEKDYSLLVKGEYKLSTGGDLNINAMGQTSGIYIQAGELGTTFNTDVNVSGEVLADSLHSSGSITAGTGIHAGLPTSANPTAGISTLGGINVGIPGPTAPGTVVATTLVTAPAVVGTAVVFGGMLLDPEGGAPLMRIIYNSHIHIAPKGPTSTPISFMP
jgi:hypothetical protein